MFDFHWTASLQTILHGLVSQGLLDSAKPGTDTQAKTDMSAGASEQTPYWFQTTMDRMFERMDVQQKLVDAKIENRQQQFHGQFQQQKRDQTEALRQLELKLENKFRVSDLSQAQGAGAIPKQPKSEPSLQTSPITLDAVRQHSQVIDGIGQKYVPPHLRGPSPMSVPPPPLSMPPTAEQFYPNVEMQQPQAFLYPPPGPPMSFGNYSGGQFNNQKLKFDGTEDFFAFIKQFESIAVFKGWNEQFKLVKLVESLSGKACDCYGWQPESVSRSYARLREQLEKMYGRVEDPMMLRAEIANVLQKGNESLEEYGQSVRELAAKAYVDSPSHVFELHACEAFLRGCQDTEIARLALLKEPKTLNEAIQYTKKISLYDQLLKKHRPRARRVCYNDPIDTEDDYTVRNVAQPSKVDDLAEAIRNIDRSLQIFMKIGDSVTPDRQSGRESSERYSRRDSPTNAERYGRRDSPTNTGRNRINSPVRNASPQRN